jgi:hypothetical protein
VTEECLLDPSRNPHLGKEGIERLLKEYLGIDKVIWLWKGMAGGPQNHCLLGLRMTTQRCHAITQHSVLFLPDFGTSSELP